MYKVIVVDDESEVRSRVISNLKSIDPDFEIIGEYDNGLDAKDAVMQDHPDLLITDIKIPYIDGITLSKTIKEQGLTTKVIIITGFDVFDYAKNALDNGVLAFITKPLTKDEMKEALNKAKKTIEEEYSLKATLDSLKEFRNNSIALVRENDLSRLIRLSSVDKTFIEKIKDDGIDLSFPYSLIAILDIDTHEINNFDVFQASEFALNKYLLTQHNENVKFYTFSRNDKLIILVKSKIEMTNSHIERIFTPILYNFKRLFDKEFSIGISELWKDNESIIYRELYLDAQKALDYRSVIGGNQLIFYDNIEDKEFKFLALDESEYKNLISVLNFETLSSVNELIDSLIEKISHKEYHASFYYITLNILNSILKGCNSITYLSEIYLPHSEILRIFSTLKTTDETKQFIKQVAKEVYKVNQKVRLGSYNSNYKKVIDYIEGHYDNVDLDLDTLANDLSLSISYIATLLRTHDTTFVKYITNLRIEKAKQLLLNPSNKILDIAERVGYNDAYYFSHCFKKVTGVSPREFRQNGIEE